MGSDLFPAEPGLRRWVVGPLAGRFPPSPARRHQVISRRNVDNAFANGRGEVLVIVVPPGSLHGQGEHYHVLDKLEATGELAAARLALRGTLTIR